MIDEPQIDAYGKDALKEYQEKRVEWLKLLNDDANAIQKQIRAMILNDASFRVFNEAINLEINPDDSSAKNPLLSFFIKQGYIHVQAFAVCKLVEEQPNNTDVSKGVASLPRLFKDLRKHHYLLTRENYVLHDGLPYAYEAVEQQMPDWQRVGSGDSSCYGASHPVPASDKSRDRHEQFDKLSGVRPENRLPTDRISESVFDTLDKWIKESKDKTKGISTIRNKFLAHAADSVSRAKGGFYSVSMNKIEETHRAVVRIAKAISFIIIPEVDYDIMAPYYNELENLNLPYVDAKILPVLRQKWDGYTKERNDWSNNVVDELVIKPTE